MMHHPTFRKKAASGFTLLEVVIVIVITGIIGAIVAVFIKDPVNAYFDTARRAELTDIADTAVRRFSRDVHLALPNSIRLSATNPTATIEFLSTHTGGRYRSEKGVPADNPLDFDGADTSFDVLGTVTDMVPNLDQIVIYNLGIPGADAYAGDNRRTYTGAAGTVSVITINAGAAFLDSPSHSFFVVDTPVTYKYDSATQTLMRYSGYTIASGQPDPPSSGGSVIATNVTDCVFTYESGLTERTGLVTMKITIAKSNESVTLYHAVHVNNAP